MGPIQLTSRIVLATNSVQLFVQRCLLNLEPEVRIAAEQTGPDEWGQWDWLGHYRLWEANRRVFLYPENYFEPELRPDKSPFFAELENTLFRKDVTDEAVTEAYRTYLEKLDAVARLQPACTTSTSWTPPARWSDRTSSMSSPAPGRPRTPTTTGSSSTACGGPRGSGSTWTSRAST